MISTALFKGKQQFSFGMGFLPETLIGRQMPLIHEKLPICDNER